MGRRGPPPTPTPILKLRGSRLLEHREGEVAPPVVAPSCPAFLSREARAEWRRQTKELLALGVLARMDRAILAAYCEAWAEFVTLTKQVEDTGRLIKTVVGNIVTNPLVRQKDRAVERLLRLAGHFGFTPAARARIKGGEVAEEADPFETLLNRKGG